MEKKLPKMYANAIDKKIGNNNEVFYSNKEQLREVVDESQGEYNIEKNINQKLRDIFNSPNYVYKADVEIKLKDKTITKKIIGKNKTHLITLDNELIPMTEIVDIKRK